MANVGAVVHVAVNGTTLWPGVVTSVNADGTVNVFPFHPDGTITLNYSETQPTDVPNDDTMYAFGQPAATPVTAPVDPAAQPQ